MALARAALPVYLDFRPRALPRISTLERLLSTASTATTTSSQASASPRTSTAPTQSIIPHETPSSPSDLPYRILRTPSNQLPIYLLAKRGGNLKQTRLRKIEGNINRLRTELQEALGLEEKDVAVNQLTRHIIIKGWRKGEVAKFLEERKF